MAVSKDRKACDAAKCGRILKWRRNKALHNEELGKETKKVRGLGQRIAGEAREKGIQILVLDNLEEQIPEERIQLTGQGVPSPNQHFLSLKGKPIMPYPFPGNSPGRQFRVIGFLLNLLQCRFHGILQGSFLIRVMHLEL